VESADRRAPWPGTRRPYCGTASPCVWPVGVPSCLGRFGAGMGASLRPTSKNSLHVAETAVPRLLAGRYGCPMAETTYSSDVRWRYKGRRSSFEKVGPLELVWELAGDPISDYYLAEETSADELWSQWIRWVRDGEHYHSDLGAPWVLISWGVSGSEEGTYEYAPHQHAPFDGDNFLTFYMHPVNADTGERVNWLRLPVVDKLWRPGRSDKGGFIQEVSGFKPHALQPAVDLRVFEAAGLSIT